MFMYVVINGIIGCLYWLIGAIFSSWLLLSDARELRVNLWDLFNKKKVGEEIRQRSMMLFIEAMLMWPMIAAMTIKEIYDTHKKNKRTTKEKA